MKKPIFCVLACLLAAGCGGSPAPTVTTGPEKPANPDAPEPIKLEPATNVSLQALLAQPREELAKQAAELEKQIHDHDGLRRDGRLLFELLPETRLPLAPPIWREATYAAQRGFSVPPYLAAGVRDTPLALHLARHGDLEAALKLAEPGAQAEVQRLKLDRNYPLEWTRVVGLLLHHAQFTLATGNPEGAKQLLAVHQQLRTLLPAATQQSPLGFALLPRGLDTLRQAAQAWRRNEQPSAAQTAEDFLASAGTPPSWRWPLPNQRDALTRQLGLAGNGPGACAAAPLRVFDLVGLPMPHEHADACCVFFNGERQVAELLFAYGPALVDFHHPQQMVPQYDALRQTKPAVTATLTTGNAYVGGLVQLRFGETKAVNVNRDFGLIQLDGSFEHNRRLLAWKQRGTNVASQDAKTLADVRPLMSGPPVEATLERAAAADLVAQARFAYRWDVKHTLASLARPLWERSGFAHVQTDKDVSLTWDDGATRCTLHLPHDKNEPFTLAATDDSGRAAEQRLAAAKTLDLAQRQARLTNQKPVARLPRSLESLTLGMARTDVERLLPGGANAVRRDMDQGLMVVYPGQPRIVDAVVRGIFARFDSAGQLTELRVRYGDHPSKAGALRKKVDAIQAAHGPGATLPLGVGLDADLPVRKGAATAGQLWQDDVTLLTCTAAAGSLEIALRHCPPAHADGEPLPPFAFLPRGPEKVALGTSRGDLLAKGAVAQEGALAFSPPADSPFDTVFVWCDGDKATRIVARCRAEAAKEPDKHLLETWARDVADVGWPWRQDLAGTLPQSWTTWDARTRYRLFWQEDGQGTHLLAEWRELK
jgi:hypothetical protein